MAASDRKAVTVKLNSELYQQLADVSALTGVTIRDLFERALTRETERARRDPELRETLERLPGFFQQR